LNIPYETDKIDVIEVLVNAMCSDRSPYRWDYNIIPIWVICLKIHSNPNGRAIDQNALHLPKP